jgi:hypothetical protein
MHTTTHLERHPVRRGTGLVGAGVLVAGVLVAGVPAGLTPARAATGECEENIRYAISSPPSYRETGFNSVVVGLSPVTRTVTFSVGEGCTIDVGDQWSVTSPYFRAQGTYDGTPASLAVPVRIGVPRSDREVGGHPVALTLSDSTGGGNDVQADSGMFLKRRTELRRFNVYRESPVPRCGTVNGSTVRARARLMRASWTQRAYVPYRNRPVDLLFSAGRTTEHNLEDNVVRTDLTGPRGWAGFTFRPGFDANYQAHHGTNGASAHSDSRRDFLHCRR